MAQQHHIGIVPTSFYADVDFSACTAQYRGVAAASTDGYVGLGNGASNPAPLGVLQNSPSAGQAAEVIVLGTAFMTARCATCTVKWGRYLTCASDGLFEPTVTGCPSHARWFGPSVTSGSVSGAGFFFGGATTCHPNLT